MLIADRYLSIGASHLRQIRTRRLPSILCPMRGGPQLGHTTIILEMAMGDSCSAIPPLMYRCGLGRTFFFTIITCSTSTLLVPGKTRSTRPCLPLSRPVITFTVSLRLMSTLICIVCLQPLADLLLLPPEKSCLARFVSYRAPLLQNFRRQRNNLQKFLFPQLAGHGAEHARANRLPGFVNQHCRILIKANVCAVAAAMLFALAHDHALHHCALLGCAVRRRLFHRGG